MREVQQKQRRQPAGRRDRPAARSKDAQQAADDQPEIWIAQHALSLVRPAGREAALLDHPHPGNEVPGFSEATGRYIDVLLVAQYNVLADDGLDVASEVIRFRGKSGK